MSPSSALATASGRDPTEFTPLFEVLTQLLTTGGMSQFEEGQITNVNWLKLKYRFLPEALLSHQPAWSEASNERG
jgi:hypothetical protein